MTSGIPIIFTNDQQLEIISLWEEGHTTKQIGDKFGVGNWVIQKHMRRWGIDISPVRYNFNCNYFNHIDSEGPAYWLGLIITDGSITKNRLRIELKRTDVNHLYKFLNCVEGNHPIRQNKGNMGVSVYDKDMIKKLAEYGVVENKTFIAKPYSIKPHLAKHFWRGVIDGDGTLYRRLIRGFEYPYIDICGTYAMCEGFKNYSAQFVNSGSNVLPLRSIYRYSLFNRFAIPVIRELYVGAEVYLDRKYERAMEYLAKWE